MIHNISRFITRAATVLLLALVTAQTAWATTTSTITVGGTDYTLFTGFTATDGSEGVGGAFTYDKAVDGDMSSSWHDQSSGVYVEFNTDDPIIPKGYIFNTYMEGYFYPQAWVLKAKANATDGWTTLSSYSGQTLSSGQEFQYACSNDGNTAYKYFRFEASNSNNNIWLTEIRLYGFENLTYTHLTVRAATCTEVGIKVDCYRRSDGKYFTDETGATELAEADVIDPMIAHTGVHHEADANHIEYWQCSMCNKYFSDASCTTEITEAQTLVVKYLDVNGTLTTLDADATAVTSTTTSWSNGWYVVYDDVTITNRISVSGTANLILGNGATLTASKGITVGSSATLNLYAQSDDEATMGVLVATAENNSNNAAIGGVNNTNFGTIVINGGKITATTNSNSGAGIGGGYGSTGGSITINGGIVSATAGGYSNSAGIGGGNNGYVASVTLNGGIITATGDTQYGGAGIGTGAYAGNGTMTITIGSGVKKLVATKGKNSDCIGKQPNANTTVNVVFKNGETTVEGDDKDAVFYDTGEGTVRQVRAKAQNHAVTMSNDLKANITAMPEYALAGETVTLTLGAAVDASTLRVNDGTSDLTLTDAGNSQYTFTMPDGNVTVTATAAQSYAVTLPTGMEVVSATNAADADGKYITGTIVTFKSEFGYEASNVSDGTNTLEPDANGIYSVTIGTADITVTATVGRSATIDLTNASGDFNAIDNDVLTGTTAHTLTIADGASITLSGATINGGIVCNGSATITLVGTNSTTGKYGKAGIQIGGSGTTLTIKGDGSLTATGGYEAAGIGLNRAWNVTEDVVGGNIVINGGTITANGGTGGAGIGAGVTKDTQNSSSRKAIVGTITITGGTVTAVGGTNADGIGAGQNDYNATIQIGTVTIYDGIEMVDASSIKDFASVVYMHDETNVTANKTNYFTIGEDGNRRLIVQKPVIAEIADQTYTGSEITPEPTVTIGSLSLTKGTDYEYSYTNNTNVGTATVRATFQGDYESLGYVEKTFTIAPWSGSGTASDPFIIEYPSQLLLLAHRVNGTNGETANNYKGKYFKLGADITFSHPANEGDDYAENYEAIGGNIDGTDRNFCGKFDGDGHTVSGIRIRKTGSDDADSYQGLFGQTWNADIHDVHLTDARITGYVSVGGIAGYNNGGYISGCSVTDSYITSTITSSKYYGTICGYKSTSGTLTNNYYHGCTVNGTAVTSGMGCYEADIAANNGALPAYRLDLGENITTPPGTFVGQTGWPDTPPVSPRLAPENGFTLAGNHYFASGYEFTPGSTLASGAAQGYTPRATLGDQLLDLYTPTGDAPDYTGTAIARLTIAADCDGKTLASTQAIYSTRQPVTVAYIKADGTPDEASAIALDGTETTLAAGWYFVGKDISYTQTLTLTGDVTLILKDGCEMNVGESGAPIEGANAIDGYVNNGEEVLTIYGQTLGTGALNVYASGTYTIAISVDALTVNGGNIIADFNGTEFATPIYSYGDININRGTVTATATGTESYGIYAYNGTVNINGGTVTANGTENSIYGNAANINGGTITANGGGIYVDGVNGDVAINGGNVTASSIYSDSGTITLGWTRPADRITASSISTGEGGTVAVADGQALTDGSGHIYTGTLTASELSGFAAETTLQPCLALADAASNTAAITDHAGQTLAVALSGRTLYKDGSWNTLCLPFAVDLTTSATLSGDNVQAMTLNTTTSNFADGTLTLNFTAATEPIPAGTPFIIKWDNTGVNITNPVFMGVTVSNATNDATVEGVLTFTGTYAPVTIPAEGDKTKLYLGSSNTLYYPNGEMTIGCHRAYFQLAEGITAGSISQARLFFSDGEQAAIEQIAERPSSNSQSGLYSLDGRKLVGMPTARSAEGRLLPKGLKKGIYVINGKKVVIK